MRGRPSPFAFTVAVVSLLLTLVVAQSVWESYYPPLEREALARRRKYYEKVLLKSDVSWKEGLYYKVLDKEGDRR